MTTTTLHLVSEDATNEYRIHLGLYRDGFAVFALKGDDERIVSRISGIRTLEDARQHAVEYHFSFGLAPITECID